MCLLYVYLTDKNYDYRNYDWKKKKHMQFETFTHTIGLLCIIWNLSKNICFSVYLECALRAKEQKLMYFGIHTEKACLRDYQISNIYDLMVQEWLNITNTPSPLQKNWPTIKERWNTRSRLFTVDFPIITG